MEIATDIEKDKSVSTTGGWLFKLCYVVGILIALAAIVVTLAHRGWMGGLIMMGATALFLLLGPISWSLGNWFRKFVMPDAYLTYGTQDLFYKKIYWLVGPQWVSFILTFFAVIAWTFTEVNDPSKDNSFAATVQQTSQPSPAVEEAAPPAPVTALPDEPAPITAPVAPAIVENSEQYSDDAVIPERVEVATAEPNHALNTVATEQKLYANTHCTTDEATLFTGMFGKKVLSFCATPAKMPYEQIEYRYGLVGKVDMTYTATTTGDGPKLFYGSVANDPQSSTNIMWFQKGTYIYAVLQCQGSSCNFSEGPSLVVLNGKKKLMESKCQGESECDFIFPIANNGSGPKSLSPIILVKEAPHDQLGL